MYHLVCGAKYRRAVFDPAPSLVDEALRVICLEIGADRQVINHQSITAKEVFRRVPSVKRLLWGGAFWCLHSQQRELF